MSLTVLSRVLRSLLTFALVVGVVIFLSSVAARFAHGCVPNAASATPPAIASAAR